MGNYSRSSHRQAKGDIFKKRWLCPPFPLEWILKKQPASLLNKCPPLLWRSQDPPPGSAEYTLHFPRHLQEPRGGGESITAWFPVTVTTKDDLLPANVRHVPLLGIQITASLSCWDKQMVVSGISDMISINSQTPYSVTSQSFEKHLGFNHEDG